MKGMIVLLGGMNMKLLEKIEELTLYTLEQGRKILKQERKLQQKNIRIREIEEKYTLQERRLQKIEKLLNN